VEKRCGTKSSSLNEKGQRLVKRKTGEGRGENALPRWGRNSQNSKRTAATSEIQGREYDNRPGKVGGGNSSRKKKGAPPETCGHKDELTQQRERINCVDRERGDAN